MQCNFLTEGCHGGHSFLVSHFLENFYTVDEECAPYDIGALIDDGC